jgi:two-component system C4-dicarboxylate transport sensor histidine kinase DctB
MKRPIDGLDTERVARLAELGLHAGGVLHELRQPLFALRALAQIGQAQGGLEPDRLAQLSMEVEHMVGLVEAWSLLIAQGGEPALVDVNEVVRNGALMLAHRVAPGRRFISELDLRPVWVRAAPGAVQQVVINLLANAWDAAAEAPEGWVRVRTALRDGAARLEVEDSGPGVAAEHRERIFEPFFTTKAPGAGTGLGLYLSRRMVEEAGGAIGIEVGDHGGARFVVAWPRPGAAG